MTPATTVFFAVLLLAATSAQTRTTVEVPGEGPGRMAIATQRLRAAELSDPLRARYGVDRADRWVLVVAALAAVVALLVVVGVLLSTEARGSTRSRRRRSRTGRWR